MEVRPIGGNMLKRMLKLELRKALRNKLFYATIAVGCAITMLGLIYYLTGYWSSTPIPTDVNPMASNDSLFRYWIGGEPFSPGSSVYFFVFPLLAAIPYGWSYCEEKKCGYLGMAAVRSGKTTYFLSKYIAVFISGGLAMVIPLVFNFLLTALFFPAVTPDPVNCTSYGVFFNSLMATLYYTMPFLYVFFYLCIDFLYCGLIACLSYAVTSIVRRRVIVVILPLFLLLAFHYSRQFVYTSWQTIYKEISPMFFLRPVAAIYQASWTVIIVEMAVLFLLTFCLSMIWERRHEIY